MLTSKAILNTNATSNDIFLNILYVKFSDNLFSIRFIMSNENINAITKNRKHGIISGNSDKQSFIP